MNVDDVRKVSVFKERNRWAWLKKGNRKKERNGKEVLPVSSVGEGKRKLFIYST